jgi:hypothetical protein
MNALNYLRKLNLTSNTVRLIVAGTAVFCILVLINSISDTREYNKPLQNRFVLLEDHSPIIEAYNKSHVPGAAFAFLALGAQANQMNCPAAIESLVRYGGWDGDIYLITDQSPCFDTETIVQNAGMESNRFHYLTVHDGSFSGEFDFTHPAAVHDFLDVSNSRNFSNRKIGVN